MILLQGKYCISSFIILLGCLIIGSCKSDYLTEEELNAFILESENGLIEEYETNGIKSTVAFKPTDLLILQETSGNTSLDSLELNRLKNKYADHYYFILSLSKNDEEAEYNSGGDYGQFSELVQTLSFRMGQYVNLTTSNRDTIPISDYIYPRTYGMSNASTLMFAFDKEKALDDKWVQFNIREFGLGTGNRNFRFRTKALEGVPNIKFDIKQ